MSVKSARGESISGEQARRVDVPDAPTIGSATNVGTSRAYNDGSATVAFTAAATGGSVSTYTATSTPGSFTGTGTSSPLTVTGLQSATSYTFTVKGTNVNSQDSALSSASNSITATTVPQAPTIGTFTDGGTGTTGTLSFTAGATGGSSITNYKTSTDNVTFTALSPAQTSSPLSLSGLSVGTATYYLKAVNTNGDSAASSGVSGTVIQPTAFESIATSSPSGVSTVTFSSIPSTYQHLQIRAFVGNSTGAGALYIRFNGDTTTANYNHHRLNANGSTVFASSGSPDTGVAGFYTIQTTSTYFGGCIIDIHDYKSTSKYKTIRSFEGVDKNGSGEVGLYSNLWMDTTAISSITLYMSSGNYSSGSVVSLYGIKS